MILYIISSETGVGDWGNALGGELGVIGIALEIETITIKDLSKGKDVKDEE